MTSTTLRPAPAQKHGIAILGAGPTGLEAALAAADAGLAFTLYEAGAGAGSHVRQWGHVRLFSSWDLNVSARMRRHLQAAGHRVPEGDLCPTGKELVDRVLEPLAGLPVVAARFRPNTLVVSISREGLLKNEEIGTPGRSLRPFRLLLANSNGE